MDAITASGAHRDADSDGHTGADIANRDLVLDTDSQPIVQWDGETSAHRYSVAVNDTIADCRPDGSIDSHCAANGCARADVVANCHGHGDTIANGDSDAVTDLSPNGHCDGSAHSYSGTSRHTTANTVANGHCDGYPDGTAHPNPAPDRHAKGDAIAYVYCHARSDSVADAFANAISDDETLRRDRGAKRRTISRVDALSVCSTANS